MPDIFKDGYLKTICDVIYEAMKNEDYELLRGIQSFDISPWMGLRGIELILSVMVDLTISSKRINKINEKEKKELWELGLYNKIRESFDVKKAGKISYAVLRSALGGIKDKPHRLFKLENAGLIKIEKKNRRRLMDDSLISLTSIWDPIIEVIEQNETDLKVFISALGKMIALGIEEKGIHYLKPVIIAINKAEQNSNEIKIDEFFDIYVENGYPYYYFTISLKTDEKKSENIRLIEFISDDKIIFTKHSINAFKVWRKAAIKRTQPIKITRN